MPVDEARADQLQAKLAEKMDIYEQILSKQQYLSGDVSFFFSCHQRTSAK